MNTIKTLLVILCIANFNCGQDAKSNTKFASYSILDLEVQNGLKINSKLLSDIAKAIGKKPENFKREVYKFDESGNEDNYVLDKGLIFKFIDEQKAHVIFEKFYKKVIEGNNYIFLTNMDFDDDYNTYYDIVIIDNSDPFKLIERIGTHGINYDVYNHDVLRKMKEWDQDVDFVFVVVDESRIHAYMQKLPEDIQQFSSDVYDFCPDVIDQGYGSMDVMISDYKESKYFWLWWD